MRRARSLLPFSLACILAGCATFPELEALVSEEARARPDPVLADRQVLAEARAAQTLDETTQQALSARAAGLRARAGQLEAPVVGEDGRQELAAARERLRDGAARVAPAE